MDTVRSGESLPHYLKSLKLDLDYDYPQLQAGNVTLTDMQLLTSVERADIKLLPLMFQTGYLTIKESTTNRDTNSTMLRLGYPNRDVATQMPQVLDEYVHSVQPRHMD